MAKSETMTIRISRKTNVAVNMVVNKLQAQHPDKRIKQDDAIWYLIERADSDVAETVDRLIAGVVKNDGR